MALLSQARVAHDPPPVRIDVLIDRVVSAVAHGGIFIASEALRAAVYVAPQGRWTFVGVEEMRA